MALVLVGLGAVTMRKLIMESARKGAFGTSAARVLQMDQRSARDVSEQPGPANYAPKSRPFKPKYDAMSAAFSSMSMRFNEPPDTDEACHVMSLRIACVSDGPKSRYLYI